MNEPQNKKKASLTQFIPIGIIVALMAAIYLLATFDYINLEFIKKQHLAIKQLVLNHPVISVMIFIIAYIVIIALSIPIGSFITMFGGYLFSPIWATLYVIVGATIGACLIFLAAKTALANFLRKKAGGFIEKLREGFKENSISYLLFLRLVPLFPFWALNIGLAFFGIGLWSYAWTTFVGIIPGTFVYAYAGAGLGEILEAGEEINVAAIFNWKIRIALIGIALITLIPIVYKRLKKKKNAG